jgi:acyl-CoA synthetase (AMP-forming)/AMP-acid ligase II
VNLADWLVRAAKLHPERPALIRGEAVEADYAEFARRAGAIGAWLQQVHGLEQGGRVAVFMSNCTEYLGILYGIWFAGGVAVPVNGKLHAREAAWILEDAGAGAVFASKKSAAALARGARTACGPLSRSMRRNTRKFPIPRRWPPRCLLPPVTWSGCFIPPAPPASPKA